MSKIQLKQELKNIASEIKNQKIGRRSCQRENNGDQGSYLLSLYKLRYDYRHKHIAYSMLRGRAYEEIERNCSRAGEPNRTLIKEIMDEHADQAVENVRACAQ